jgi:hypothetical protein
MKLDQALKLYIGLYCLCFMFSWFVSIPMIIHVSRDGECLLFVSPYITYGPAAGCWISGLGFIAVAVAAMICFVLHVMQLNSLKKYLRQPGPHSSKDYHSPPTRVFWPMVSKFYFTNIYILPKQIYERNIIEDKSAVGNIKKCYQIFDDDVISAYLKKDMTSFAYMRSTPIHTFIAV